MKNTIATLGQRLFPVYAEFSGQFLGLRIDAEHRTMSNCVQISLEEASMTSKAEFDHSDMDAEHKVQIGLIQALEQSLQKGSARGDMTRILSQLVEYTNIHFMSEQLLMRLHAYPEIGTHEMEHDHLIEQLRKVEAGFAAGDSDLATAEISLLKNLVLDHIKTHDQSFAKYLTDASGAAALFPQRSRQLH